MTVSQETITASWDPDEQSRRWLAFWRRWDPTLTELVKELRDRLPDPDDPLCDELLDRLDRIDAHLDVLESLGDALRDSLLDF